MRHSLAALCASLFLLTSACAGGDGLTRKTGPEFEAETQSWLAGLRLIGANGYWLVTRGYHSGDDLVAVASNARWSHASVLDLDKMEIIEAIGSGVRKTPLAQFLREAHRLRIIRPAGWSPERGREAVLKARSKLGSGYDFLGVAGAPSDKRFYCSELAAWSMGLEVDKQGAWHVLHPANMHTMGELLWETGARDGKADVPADALVERAAKLRQPAGTSEPVPAAAPLSP